MARCTLNNMIMRNIRRTQAYQTVIVDLALLGVIKKADAETLIGCEIPDYIVSPVSDTADDEE